jgi:DNA adenine methylase
LARVLAGPALPRRCAPWPLLKWPGGKRQLLPAFRLFYPANLRGYYEPFVGSGAVFFDLYGTGQLAGRPVLLADRNADLLGCYEVVRDEPEGVVAALERLDAQHRAGGSACYYTVREAFNAARATAAGEGVVAYTPDLAAMLIYLNRTGFNGLFRLNAQGLFNVPAGRYARPRICNADLVRAVSATFRDRLVTLRHCDFDEGVASAGPGDFLYLDPPYAPLSPTSAFGAYTASRFTEEDQQRLCSTVVDLARRGCHVMLSNSSASVIEDAYRVAARSRRAGLALWRLTARRAINAHPARRGPVAELLLTNLRPRAGRTEGLTQVA